MSRAVHAVTLHATSGEDKFADDRLHTSIDETVDNSVSTAQTTVMSRSPRNAGNTSYDDVDSAGDDVRTRRCAGVDTVTSRELPGYTGFRRQDRSANHGAATVVRYRDCSASARRDYDASGHRDYDASAHRDYDANAHRDYGASAHRDYDAGVDHTHTTLLHADSSDRLLQRWSSSSEQTTMQRLMNENEVLMTANSRQITFIARLTEDNKSLMSQLTELRSSRLAAGDTSTEVLLRHQMDVYKEDFENEKKDKERLAAEVDSLRKQLNTMQSELRAVRHRDTQASSNVNLYAD